MSFSTIKGQASALKVIKQDLLNRRFAHAYLFVGPDGTGKATAAKEMARAILCQNGFEACNQCLSCKKFSHDNHPDFKIIKPEKDTLGIEQIRQLKREIGYKPVEGSFKIYLIEDAQGLTPEAGNSLLKTLEEPPEYAILIITAPHEKLLLPTIVSRCRIVKFNPLPEGIIAEYLQKNKKVQSEKSWLLASLASGSLGRALSYLEDQKLFNKRRELLEKLAGLKNKEYLKMHDFVQKLLEYGEDTGWEFIFNLFLCWYRDLIIVKSGSEKKIYNSDFLPAIKKIATDYSLGELEEIINRIQNTYNLISRNINKELALEVMLIKLH